MSKIEDALPLTNSEFGMLIKWDTTTGQFAIQAEGPRVNIQTVETLFKHALESLKKTADDTGMLGPKIERNNEGKPIWLK